MLKKSTPTQTPTNTPPPSPAVTPVRDAFAKASVKSSVSRVVARFPNADQLWHVIASIPAEKFYQDHARLSVLLDEYIDARRLHADDGFTTLTTNILNVLVTSRGVYYTSTNREVEDCEVYAYHIAHTILHEKINGVKIKGKDHLKKAKAMYKHLSRVFEQLNAVIDDCRGGPELNKLLCKFADYLQLQRNCLAVALVYVEDRAIAPGAFGIDDAILQEWQAEIPDKRTPLKLSEPARMAIERGAEYKRRLTFDTTETADPVAAASSKTSPEKKYRPS